MENNIRIFIFGDSFASNLFQEGYERLPDHHINPTQIGQYLLDLKEENIDDALWFSDWLTKFGYQVYNYGQGGSDNQTILEQFTKLDKEFRPGDRIILWLSSFSRFQWINDMSERWSINANSVLHGLDYKNNDLLLKQCLNRENSFRNGYMSRVTLPFYEYFIDLHSRYNPIVVSFCNQTNQKMKNYKHFVSFDTTGSVSLLKFGNSFKTNIITPQSFVNQKNGKKIKMNQRKYLPTLSELVDRLSIVQLKEVFITEHKQEYSQEIKDILHDIQLLLDTSENKINAETIRAIVVLSQMNLHIWHNESNYRKGIRDGNNLELTHGLNGIRNTSKNKIQEMVGGRKDYKIDCLAAEFKDWEISW